MADDLLIRAALRDEMSGPLRDIRNDLERTTRELRQTGNAADKTGKDLNRMTGGIDRLAGGIGRGLLGGLKMAAVGVGVLGVATGGLAVKLVGLASEAGETQSKFDTVFKGMEKDMGAHVKGISDKFGIFSRDLQDAAAGFGIFGKAAGVPKEALGQFSKDLLGAGLDLGSFYNQDPGEVFAALQSGLSGEAEPLKQFGIFLTDASMKAQAASMGLTGELTEQQKVMVRQAQIMDQFKKQDAYGDLERTQFSLANQMKGLKGRILELGTALGKGLEPAAAKIVGALSKGLAPIVSKLTEQMPNLNAALKDGDWDGVAEVIDNMAGNTGRLVTPIRELFEAFAAGDLSGAVGAFDRLVGAGGNLEGAVATAVPILRDLGTIIADVIHPAVRDAADALPIFLSPLALLPPLLSLMADNAGPVKLALEGIVLGLMAYRGALLISTGAQAAWGVATSIAAGITWLYTAAIGTNNSLLYNRIGFYALEAGAMARSAGAWLASTAATAANTVVGLANKAVYGVGWLMTFIGVKALELGAWLASTAATAANTVVGLANKAVYGVGWLMTFIGVKALELGAWLASTAATVAATVASGAYAVASGAVRVATMVWTGAQWLLNAALMANPIGLVIAAVALLIGGVILAHTKVGWFRDGVDALWGAIKTAASWLGQMFLKFTPLGQIISHTGDITNAFKDVLGWLWDKLQAVWKMAGDLGGALRDGLGGALGWVKDRVNDLMSFLQPLIDKLNGIKDAAGAVAGAAGKVAGWVNPFGDTATSKAVGSAGPLRGSQLDRTLGMHAALSAGSGIKVTNALVGGGGMGGGSGDHQAGRALDLVGSGLPGYAAALRAAGGYAAMHGSGKSRHLHGVYPAGDTAARSMIRATAGGRGAGGGGDTVIFREGSIVVHAHNEIDVERAVARGLATHARERAERA